jgi:hypothetical protein
MVQSQSGLTEVGVHDALVRDCPLLILAETCMNQDSTSCGLGALHLVGAGETHGRSTIRDKLDGQQDPVMQKKSQPNQGMARNCVDWL